MPESNSSEELRVKVTSLESQVQRLNNIVWVVGVVAVIFGVAGGWGTKTLSQAQEKLDILGDQLTFAETGVSKYVDSLEAKFDKYYAAKKKDLDSHIEAKMQSKDLDSHIDEKMKSAVKYGEIIAIKLLPKNGNFFLSGGPSVRTSTTNLQLHEKWQIVKVP